MGRDWIYSLCNRNRTNEKFDIFIYPTLERNQQAIIFTPHISTIFYEVKQLKNLGINAVAYTYRLHIKDRDATREDFENGGIDFLFATPRMYFRNRFFRYFVNEQVQNGNLSFIVFDDAKFLFEYGQKTSRYDSYYNFSKLKDVAEQQQWIVIADGECDDRLEEIGEILHLNDPVLMNIKYDKNMKAKHMKQKFPWVARVGVVTLC